MKKRHCALICLLALTLAVLSAAAAAEPIETGIRSIQKYGTLELTVSGNSLLEMGYEYGDIVIARKESFDEEPIVKRVIATEGQRVALVNGVVYVDGERVDESDYRYCPGIDRKANMKEVTVPEGHVFLLGDHRDASLDSRAFLEKGLMVDERTVIGKVLFRVYPFSDFGGID